MGMAACGKAVASGHAVLWLVHRIELLAQARRAAERWGLAERIDVRTIQELVSTGERPACGLVVMDECHHMAAPLWSELARDYARVRTLGLTATPERRDGAALGDIFDHLVVAASYSELLEAGHLVSAAVYQPPRIYGKDQLAMGAVDAYRQHGQDGKAFVYCSTVADAYDTARQFTDATIPAACIEGETVERERHKALAAFRASDIRVLTNVYVLTEGVDVPDASVCILARPVGHASSYLQMAGRVLRPAEGKTEARVLDLTGASLRFGLPTDDREYSLEGLAISRPDGAKKLKACKRCGAAFPADGRRKCPECGYQAALVKGEVRIYDEELQRVYAGAETPQDAKGKELERLRAVATSRGFSAGWVAREYKKTFGERPPAHQFTTGELRAEWARVRAIGARTYGRKYALARFKSVFGIWPERSWG